MRLSKPERELWRERLSRRVTPTEMLAMVHELHDQLGLHAMTQAGVEFFRDAFVAGHFASSRGADTVRLWPDTRPDFELITGNTSTLFEVVEADLPGRNRGAEYREAILLEEQERETWEHDPAEAVADRARKAPAMLREASRRKAAGGYDPAWCLVVYLNLSDYGWHTREVEDCMRPSTRPASLAFKEVWVLWKRQTYLTWSNGQAA